MGTAGIRIVLIDDQRAFVESMKSSIEAEPDLSVVGVGYSIQEAKAVCRRTQPDIVALDVKLEVASTFDLIDSLRVEEPGVKFLFLSATTTGFMLSQALRLRVAGYISKRETLETVIQALRDAADGKESFSAEVRQKLRFDPVHQSYTTAASSRLESLTSRQLEVLRHLARGDSVKEVARKMFLSCKSIDSHKYRIMQRLGVRDRVHLARYAIREGLVAP